MPELPEVESVARGLQYLQGQTLTDLKINDKKVWFESELPPEILRGATLKQVERRGKYLLYRFSNCDVLQHLRMTGKMLSLTSEHIPQVVRTQKGKQKQIRCEFIFKDHTVAFYDSRRFGTLTAVSDGDNFLAKKRVAPDPIHQRSLALEHFLATATSTTRPIKAALLDQSIFAGAGNIYVDEVLHIEKIHPKTPVAKVKDKNKLFTSLVKILETAIEYRGTTIINYRNADGEKGGFVNFLKVYGRTGELCSSCRKERIQSIRLAGRTTHFCKSCQKFR